MASHRFRPTTFAGSFLGVVGLLALCAPALAMKPIVLDAGDVFSPAAIKKADEVIAQIKQKFGKDLMIETYATVPADMRDAYQKKGKENFFTDWLGERGRALQVDGVMLLITKNPGRLEVGVGKATREKIFTLADRELLRTMMTKSFQEKKFDEGLIEGVEFVLNKMEQNAGGAVATGQGGPTALPPVKDGAAPAAVDPHAEAGKAPTPGTPATKPSAAPRDEHPGADF